MAGELSPQQVAELSSAVASAVTRAFGSQSSQIQSSQIQSSQSANVGHSSVTAPSTRYILHGDRLGSFGKNGTSNFNDEMEWAWHVESHARYADIVRPFCCLL